ncbi:GGDEF domain-containing protein [Calditerrivibrio nitroreducens]|uniref:GGDEF domain-containing protein n=1 Tax=Calditerrivibrio nitroreducens TaxID=477976 RepID=UPI003C70A1F1
MNEFVVYHNIIDEQLLSLLNKICHSLSYCKVNEYLDSNNVFFIIHIKKESDLEEIDLSYLVQKNFVLIITEEILAEFFYKLSNDNRFFIAINGNKNKDLLEINIKGFINYGYKVYELLNQIGELEDRIFDLAFATTDVLEQKEKMEDIAIRDGMTKLFNHSYFRDTLLKKFEHAKLNNEIFTIAILDLDYFKHVNDRYGHLKGDEVLKAFAMTIVENIDAKRDIPSRYGGEEFAIIFDKQDIKEATKKIDAIRKSLSEKAFTYENSCFKVTFSAGLTQYSVKFIDIVEMIKYADEALYQSKKDGRNRNTIKLKE